MPVVSVVLPCYNEGKSIPEILRKFRSLKMDFELILVDNGSFDDTGKVLEKELPKYRFARSVKVTKNIGYGFGILSGLRASKGKFLAYSHADMQCDPYDIYKSWKILSSSRNPGKVLVKGNRGGRKNFFTSCFHAVALILFFRKFDDINGQPKIFHRSLVNEMKDPPFGFSFDFYVQYKALKSGCDIISFPVSFRKRMHGKSNWSSSTMSKIKTVARFTAYMIKLRFSRK
ncbi:MAG: glycosyltransferase family 2 protein [Candidatus Aenigmarchaeota archaeon]|nr:glycosyltransferase family 2 protein [Candidatus Aenigmarchaeota archaeon]MDI6722347.1 glycosyltransferase family 2 protein [Candidatus Aenigmarchaeota archaeon]